MGGRINADACPIDGTRRLLRLRAVASKAAAKQRHYSALMARRKNPAWPRVADMRASLDRGKPRARSFSFFPPPALPRVHPAPPIASL